MVKKGGQNPAHSWSIAHYLALDETLHKLTILNWSITLELNSITTMQGLRSYSHTFFFTSHTVSPHSSWGHCTHSAQGCSSRTVYVHCPNDFRQLFLETKIKISTKLPELHDLKLSGLLQKEQLHWSRMAAFLLTSSNQISPAFVRVEAVPCKPTKSKPRDFINWVKTYVHQEWRRGPDIGQAGSTLVFKAYLHEYH